VLVPGKLLSCLYIPIILDLSLLNDFNIRELILANSSQLGTIYSGK